MGPAWCPTPHNLIYNYMTLQETIDQLKEKILTLKLKEPYHPSLNGLLQQLDKLDEQKRATGSTE